MLDKSPKKRRLASCVLKYALRFLAAFFRRRRVDATHATRGCTLYKVHLSYPQLTRLSYGFMLYGFVH